MGLRIPKAHKAITEARVREHPSDVDLRYTIIGLGIVVFILLVLILDLADKNDEMIDSRNLEVAVFSSFIVLLVLYIASKLCKAFPRGARWAISYFSLAVSLGYLSLVLFVGRELLPIAICVWMLLSIVSWVSIRQIYKYHSSNNQHQPTGSAVG